MSTAYTHEELKKVIKLHELWLRGSLFGKRADLRLASLKGADLKGADLRGADLIGVDLRGADLRWANLSRANLSRANLMGANLSRAYLRGANLNRATGNGREIKTLQLPTYHVNVTKNEIQIGFKRFFARRCYKLTDEQISEIDNDELGWWNTWKDVIFKVHKTFFTNG